MNIHLVVIVCKPKQDCKKNSIWYKLFIMEIKDQKNDMGQTAMHIATEKGNKSIVEKLLKKYALEFYFIHIISFL